MHSFMLLRNGKTAAEGYWKPFSENSIHRMYSVSKTFVSAAAGVLCGEGELSLDDRVYTFFPDKLPENMHPYHRLTTVRDLLMMATPNSCNSYSDKTADWVASFFAMTPSHLPGTIFSYDTAASHLLGVLVERITGKSFIEYLYEKVLRYIGFSRVPDCVRGCDGYAWGGSGVLCTTRELAAFAQLFLDGGAHGGRQLIPRDYVEAATSFQISNETQPLQNCGYKGLGYGYQIWLTRDGSFSFLGMGNQLAVCVPDKNLLFVCTADTQGGVASRAAIFDALWDEIIDAPDAFEPGSAEDDRALEKKLASLEIAAQPGEISTQTAEKINGVTFFTDDNPAEISRIRFELDPDSRRGAAVYLTPRGEKRLEFGLGCVVETTFPETHYYGRQIGTPLGRGYRCLNTAAWIEPHKLLIRCFIADDYFGNLTVTASFAHGAVSLLMNKNAEWFLNEYTGFACGFPAE